MWKPKSKEFEKKANIVAKEYSENRLSVPEIARLYRLAQSSVYRYLSYKGIEMRPRNRDKNGKFTLSR